MDSSISQFLIGGGALLLVMAGGWMKGKAKDMLKKMFGDENEPELAKPETRINGIEYPGVTRNEFESIEDKVNRLEDKLDRMDDKFEAKMDRILFHLIPKKSES